MPRSPCSESTGWRNIAGVPVDVNVAAILRAMSPDLPTPETMTRPLAAARISSARTRLPRSTSRSEAGASLRTHCLLAARPRPRPLPDLDREADNSGELIERHHVGSVGRRPRGVRMRLEEEAIGSSGRRGVQQRGNEAALSAARAIGTLPRLLDGMRGVKDHGRLAGLLQPRKTPHVDDQIAVAEERAALGDGDF